VRPRGRRGGVFKVMRRDMVGEGVSGGETGENIRKKRVGKKGELMWRRTLGECGAGGK